MNPCDEVTDKAAHGLSVQRRKLHFSMRQAQPPDALVVTGMIDVGDDEHPHAQTPKRSHDALEGRASHVEVIKKEKPRLGLGCDPKASAKRTLGPGTLSVNRRVCGRECARQIRDCRRAFGDAARNALRSRACGDGFEHGRLADPDGAEEEYRVPGAKRTFE